MTKVIDIISNVRKVKPFACHHLGTKRQEYTRETSIAVGRRSVHLLDGYDLAKDSARQANLKAAIPSSNHGTLQLPNDDIETDVRK